MPDDIETGLPPGAPENAEGAGKENAPESPFQAQKEKLKEITDGIEQGIKNLFASGEYAQYLKTMSRFHSYSLNNCLLIAAQYPTATAVAGYRAWQQNFGRQVRKGEKGIKILAPCKYKVETEEKDENGDPKLMELTGFRVVSVFALEQTEGKELPTIGVDELTGDVKDYQRIFNALVSISPVPVGFEEIENGAKGYYHDREKRIAIKTGMSQAQTIKTLLHEVSHATYHTRDKAEPDHPIDRRHKETEAESIAFCVGSALSIVDSGDYTFPYLASWASGKDARELRDSLERIRSASDEMITAIDQSLQKQANREKQRSRDEGR